MKTTSPSPARRNPTVAGAPPVEGLRAYRWLIGVWTLVALFAVVTALRSSQVEVPLRDPGGRMFTNRLVSALLLLFVLAVVDAVVRTVRSGWTFRGVLTTLRVRWSLERLALAVSGLLAYHIVYICYRNMKSWVAFNQLRDDELLRLDTWLFFGHSPAVLLHDILGQHDAAYVLMVFYKAFTYLVPLSVVSSLVFFDRIRDGYVFLVASLWVWILGVAAYYVAPSLGPYASAPQDFAQLPHTAITVTQAEYLTQRAHLLQNPAAGDAFASLGAFASLHVGFTCLMLLMLRYYGLRWAARVMATYLVVVILATIYLGWHYVVDDVAGVGLAALAVLFARLMVYPGGRPPALPRTEHD